MKTILVVITLVSGSDIYSSTTFQEFPSEKACSYAADVIQTQVQIQANGLADWWQGIPVEKRPQGIPAKPYFSVGTHCVPHGYAGK